MEETNMCVGLPARVVSINDGTAIIDANGAKRGVSSNLIEDLEPGDYASASLRTVAGRLQQAK